MENTTLPYIIGSIKTLKKRLTIKHRNKHRDNKIYW